MANPEQDVVQSLVDKYFSGLASAAEKVELVAYVVLIADDDKLGETLELAWQKHEPLLAMPDEMSERIVISLFGQEKGDKEPAIRVPQGRGLFIRRYGWVAAGLLLF